MRKEEKQRAIALRQQGHSFNEISHLVGVSKSSVSLWVRDVKLTEKQKKHLSEKGRTLEAIENRRTARLANERAKRLPIFHTASSSINKLSKGELLFLGLALYWGEGSKTNRGSLNFTNGDPQLVQIMIRFFKEICNVPDKKFKGHVLLHHHLNAKQAEKYWHTITNIPMTQFHKTSMQHNKRSKGKRDSLPWGTFMLTVCDTKLFLQIAGWMDGTYKRLIPKHKQVPCKFHAIL